MIDDYMKLLAMVTLMPMVPVIVQKKLLFQILNDSKISLNKSELESIEHQYKDKPDCISIAHIRYWLHDCASRDREFLMKKMDELVNTLDKLEQKNE